jgi:pSer/pThr/pTyr-binding forkhead associated (FHA) protein
MKVELISANAPHCTFVLDDLPAMIGRNRTAEVPVDDAELGEFQSMIEQDRGRLMVEDIAGGLGTFVNGVRIRKIPLKPGDTLRVGNAEFLVKYER